MMVMSATYQQSSVQDSSRVAEDPNNIWLSRGTKRRLPAWMIRDQALFISSLLSDSIGGPSVNPYQPPGIWEEATFGFKAYEQDHGINLYRRSLYTFWRRIVGPTNLFDNSPRQTCHVKPLLTNTPMHALTTLNDMTYVEAARVMAAKVMNQAGTEATQLALAFRMATARKPNDQEASILSRRLSVLKNHYRENLEEAKQVISAGEYAINLDLDQASLAAMAGICSLILNMDEVVCKQ